jgi:hypothetical protein
MRIPAAFAHRPPPAAQSRDDRGLLAAGALAQGRGSLPGPGRTGTFELVHLTPADVTRMGELVLQYADFLLGGVDASVIAVAERFGVDRVATLDRRHFSVVKPAHVPTLTLVP